MSDDTNEVNTSNGSGSISVHDAHDSVGVTQPDQFDQPKPRPHKRPHDDVDVSTGDSFALGDDAIDTNVCHCPYSSSGTGSTGSPHGPHGLDQPHGGTDGKVGDIYEAMQWPTCHTTKLLDHMSKRTDDSDDSESDDDMPCPSSPNTKVPGLKKLFKLFDSIPFSTAFSGIDAPGTGLSQQVAELNSRIAMRNLQRQQNGSAKRESQIGEPIHLNAIEWFGASQTELRNHPSAPRCLYGDICNFQHSYFRTMKDKIAASGKTRDILSKLFKQAEAIKL